MVTREASGAVLPEGAPAAALDALPFGAVVLDEHERVVYANRTARRMVRGIRIGGRAQWAAVPQPTANDPGAGDDPRAGADPPAPTPTRAPMTGTEPTNLGRGSRRCPEGWAAGSVRCGLPSRTSIARR